MHAPTVGVAGEEPMGPDGLVHPADRLPAQPHSTCLVRWEFLFFSLKKKNPKLFICLFLPVLGLHCYTWALFSCGKQGLFFVAVCRASHYSGFSCHGAWAFEHRLSSCWVWAQLPHGMWDLPGLGMEPVFPHTHRRTQPLDHQGSPSSHFLNLKGMFFLEGYDMSVGWCSGRTFMRRWRQERPQAGV